MRPRPLHWLVLLSVIVTMTTGSAIAQSTTQPVGNVIRRTGAAPASQPTADAAPAGTDTLRVVLSLAAVLGLIALAYWGARKMLPSASAGRATQAIQVLSRTHLSGKQKILLIQVGQRVLVVGDSGQQLNTLCEIDDADEAAALIGQINGGDRAATAACGFADLLASATERFRKPPPAPAPQAQTTQTSEFTQTHKELEDLLHRVRGIARQGDRA